ncbi:hypothetical protein HII36_23520 [Nonomuraea sp. NN258]|uniref:DUF5719 family protein n=1 Tax=Nonomuraea antri TaxID=2730852 RepID=UPI001569F7E2|nr:DUF5719 family protein [Nonomuraea antri]NRQ34780.1 hypothetical protein [Nonomuraea antri]
MKAFVENRFGLFVLVVVALAALYGVAFVTRPAPQLPRQEGPSKVAVESVTAVCPGTKGASVQVRVPEGLSGERMKNAGPYVKHGPAALEAGYTTRVTEGGQRGLAGVRCTEPAATTWLVGPGPAEADVRLYLTNADKAPALFDVQVHAAEGQVSGDQGVGLELAPGEHREIDLKTLAPAADVMAVGITTAFGRIAVAARATMADGGGVDWLPSATPPATRVVVPGIPGGGGRRQLLIAAPGENDALVRIKAVTEDAEYAMKGRESADVLAGSVAAVDVTTGIGGESAALVLDSNVPIVAGAIITGTGDRSDVAFTAGTPVLNLGSAVAVNGAGSRLVLTALGGPGRARVQVVPAKGAAAAPVELDVPAGRTRSVKLKAKGAFAVLVTPVSGELYGARVIEERLKSGLLITAQPLAPARVWTLVPALTETARVVLP